MAEDKVTVKDIDSPEDVISVAIDIQRIFRELSGMLKTTYVLQKIVSNFEESGDGGKVRSAASMTLKQYKKPLKTIAAALKKIDEGDEKIKDKDRYMAEVLAKDPSMLAEFSNETQGPAIRKVIVKKLLETSDINNFVEFLKFSVYDLNVLESIRKMIDSSEIFPADRVKYYSALSIRYSEIVALAMNVYATVMRGSCESAEEEGGDEGMEG